METKLKIGDRVQINSSAAPTLIGNPKEATIIQIIDSVCQLQFSVIGLSTITKEPALVTCTWWTSTENLTLLKDEETDLEEERKFMLFEIFNIRP